VNPKHLIAAVLVVVAAGLATGFAIGGKTTTKTVTVAVTHTVKAAAPTTTTAATTTSDPPITTAAGPGDAPADAVYLVDAGVSDSQDNINDLDLSTSAQLQDGKTEDYSTTFVLYQSPYSQLDFWTFEIPVPTAVTRFKTRMGFAKGVSTAHRAEVSFYANELPGGKRLKAPERLAATSIDDVDLDVTGVRTLILKVSPLADDWQDPTFVLGGAHFE
jgi:hypothetical protein